MTKLNMRIAVMADVEQIVALLKDDVLGSQRELVDIGIYKEGLEAILLSEDNDFWIADIDHEIVGCFQLTYIPSLSRGASKRAQIESVRVKTSLRGHGIGQNMMRWAIEHSRKNGCSLVQLTTDKTREDAHKFYVKLGFEASHTGMKLKI